MCDPYAVPGKGVAEASGEGTRTFEIGPEDFGLEPASIEHLRGGSAERNAQRIQEIFAGARRDEARSLVVANAAAALFVGGAGPDLKACARLAG